MHVFYDIFFYTYKYIYKYELHEAEILVFASRKMKYVNFFERLSYSGEVEILDPIDFFGISGLEIQK